MEAGSIVITEGRWNIHGAILFGPFHAPDPVWQE
jgi:hypothetical protein